MRRFRQHQRLTADAVNGLMSSTEANRPMLQDGVSATTRGWNHSSRRDEQVGATVIAHLDVVQASATTLRVYGGSWWVNAGNRNDIAGMGEQVKLSTDVGTSENISKYKTITVSGSGTTKYVYVALNAPFDPTTLAAGFDTLSNIDVDSIPQTSLILAAVTLDASGNISKVERYWFGGDYSNIQLSPDGDSIGFTSGSATFEELQIAGWSGAGSEQPAVDDKFLFQDATDGGTGYADITALGAALVDLWQGSPPWFENWSELDDTSGDPTSIGDAYIPVTIGNLLTLTDAIPSGISGPWWVLGNADTTGAYGAVIGDGNQDTVIDLDNKELEDGATGVAVDWGNGHLHDGVPVVVDWFDQQLRDLVGTATVDWDARQFDGDDWTFLSGTICKSDDPAGGTAADTGSVQLQGGFSAKDECWVGAGTLSSHLMPAVSGYAFTARDSSSLEQADLVSPSSWAARFYDGSNRVVIIGDIGNSCGLSVEDSSTIAVKLADGTYAANAIVGRINSAEGFSDAGNAGQDVANWFGGGILTGSPTAKLVSALNPGDTVLVI